MTDSSTPEGTGLTVDEAANAIGLLLGDDAQSDETEATEEETPQSDEEDEGEEPEASEEDTSDDDAESDEEATEQPQTYTVKVDGEEIAVTLEELQSGYQRTKDYTRKTQALADERKALEPERAELQAERAQTAELLRQLKGFFDSPAHSEQDLLWMRENDPTAYAVAIADESRRQDKAQKAEAERNRLEKANADERARAHEAAMVAEAQKLSELRPTWKDPKTYAKAIELITDYGRERGWTQQEIGSIEDHRIYLALHEAALYRALQTNKPQPKPKAPGVKTARPGVATGQQPKSVTDVTRARQKLAKTGNVNDAAALFMHLIPDS